MDVREAILKRRSIRRFLPIPVSKDQIQQLIEAARLAPQAANVQPVRYMIVHQEELLPKVFECTKWAGYLENYTPEEGFRPTVYILLLIDESLKKGYNDTDAGAAAENLILSAVEMGLGTCWLGAIDRERLRKLLGVPEGLSIHTMIALGYPAEDPVWEDKEGESIKYYLDEEKRIHVPKRRMGEIIIPITPEDAISKNGNGKKS